MSEFLQQHVRELGILTLISFLILLISIILMAFIIKPKINTVDSQGVNKPEDNPTMKKVYIAAVTSLVSLVVFGFLYSSNKFDRDLIYG